MARLTPEQMRQELHDPNYKPGTSTQNEEKTDPPKELRHFNHELLPESVAPYVFDVADRMDKAPLSFAGVAALAALSAAIGRRVGVRPKLHDSWTVIPNLWGMLVAPPSIKKTPIQSEMLKPLTKAEIKENDIFLQELREYQEEQLVYEAELKEYKKKLAKGEREKSMPTPPKMPVRKRYIINDATIEKVAELMVDNPYGLMLVLDELSGFIKKFDKAGREGDRSFYLEAWNGDGGMNVDRIQRGSFYVPHVCASIFGTIQPDVVMNLVSGSTSGASGGDGFLQRFQLVSMVEKSNFEPVDRVPNYIAKEEYENTIHEVIYANPLEHGAKEDKYKEGVLFYRFSKEANAIFEKWRTSLHDRVEKEAEHNPALSSHLGKFPSFFASLALILFYTDRLRGVTLENDITEEYALRSLELCNFFEEQANLLYDMDSIKERKREALEEKILKKVQELQTLGELPISYGKLAEKIRGARAEDCRKALKGVAVEKDKKIFGLR